MASLESWSYEQINVSLNLKVWESMQDLIILIVLKSFFFLNISFT